MAITDQEKQKQIASHEAGHAVMTYLRGLEVERIVVDFENEAMPGYTDRTDIKPFIQFPDGRQRGRKVVRKYLYTDLLINLAGIQAVKVLFNYTSASGYGQDEECAMVLIKQLMTGKDDKAQSAYMDRAHKTVLKMLEPYRGILLVIRNKLLQQGSISSDEFLAAIKGGSQ